MTGCGIPLNEHSNLTDSPTVLVAFAPEETRDGGTKGKITNIMEVLLMFHSMRRFNKIIVKTDKLCATCIL